jgi:hypothetical protein
MNIKTNSVVGNDGNSAIQLTYGATLPSGSRLNVQGNVNISGVSTVGLLSATNANVSGIVTATSFIGDGSGLSITTVSVSKSIALKYIISDPPLRS